MMKNGGPAFPAHHFDLCEEERGLTVRDYFAAKAMQTMLMNEFRKDSCANIVNLSHDAYKMADAMLKEREK